MIIILKSSLFQNIIIENSTYEKPVYVFRQFGHDSDGQSQS